MEQLLLLGCPTKIEAQVRDSALGPHYTIQAVRDLRQPEVVSRVAQAALIVLHESAAPRDLPEIVSHLRRQTTCPLLVLLEQGDEPRLVAVLMAGADDCMVPAASEAELVARLRAQLRRHREYAGRPTAEGYQCGEISLDLLRHEVRVRGELVALTPREFALLECLAQRAGRAVSRDELLRRVWDYTGDVSTRTLDVHVGRLRQKIEADPAQPRQLITIPGVGYKLAT